MTRSRALSAAVFAGLIMAMPAAATPLSYQFSFTQLGGGGIDVSGQLEVTAYAWTGATTGTFALPTPGNGAASASTSATQVGFIIRNVGASQSVISNAYFFDGTILGSSLGIAQTSGVSFVVGGSPPSLPGFTWPAPGVEFLASSTAPPPFNGVANGGVEALHITFDLQAGMTWENTYQKILAGELRVGFQVIDQPNGGSSQYISDNPVIPLPAAGGLGLAGLFLVCAVRHRR